MNPETSRRDFIKTTLGAGALALTAATVANADTAPGPQLDKKLGIALVGLGYYSTDILAPALQETKNIALKGIVTGTPAKEKQWAEKYHIAQNNIYNYENFDRIAENQDIDIIYVVLPNSMHKEYTIRAAQAGKHVICEKPMALNSPECEAMIAACRENNVQLSIGYRMQFEPHTQELMRYSREKVFGEIKYVTAAAGFVNRSAVSHWKLQQSYGGGALMDMGVYSIQGARYSIGAEPLAVTAQQYKTDPERFQVDETVTMQLEFPGGALANVMTSFSINTNILHIVADKGWIQLNPFSGYRGIKMQTNKGPIQLADINQQAAQMDEVAWCIANKQPMRVPGEEGLRDIKIVEAVRESLRTGARVSLV
ncbi:MAG TPA: Gfo/Idh/MocA family oxidoreductase [bacterium]|nr:Gfo/Idh/MocA family oxidoreductase [bacterium]HPN43732.1 Gfo/Idh/MocA family oxidoreductase [bacterium]